MGQERSIRQSNQIHDHSIEAPLLLEEKTKQNKTTHKNSKSKDITIT